MADSKASKAKTSIKHLQIDKSQSRILIMVAVAIALTVFGLFATKALITKGLYQQRVIKERRAVAFQLKTNVDSAQSLFNQYSVFVEEDPNVIGGNKDSNEGLGGNNSQIILNALPSTYDAPALAASIEKVLTDRNVVINSIQVADDPLSYSDEPQVNPQSKAITLSFEGTTSFTGAERLMIDFERSIRPFDVTQLEISGTDRSLRLIVNLTTYMQPARSLNLEPTKEVQ